MRDAATHAARSIAQDFSASARLFGPDLGAWPAEKRATLLQMLVHCADIGNPARALPVSLKWTARIVEEQLAEVLGACQPPADTLSKRSPRPCLGRLFMIQGTCTHRGRAPP